MNVGTSTVTQHISATGGGFLTCSWDSKSWWYVETWMTRDGRLDEGSDDRKDMNRETCVPMCNLLLIWRPKNETGKLRWAEWLHTELWKGKENYSKRWHEYNSDKEAVKCVWGMKCRWIKLQWHQIVDRNLFILNTNLQDVHPVSKWDKRDRSKLYLPQNLINSNYYFKWWSITVNWPCLFSVCL